MSENANLNDAPTIPAMSLYPIAEGLSSLLKLHGVALSVDRLRDGAALNSAGDLTLARLPELGHHFGFSTGLFEGAIETLSPLVLPALALLPDGNYVILKSITKEEVGLAAVQLPETTVLRSVDAFAGAQLKFIVVKPTREGMSRGLVPQVTEDLKWFWDVLWRYRSYYIDAIIATLIANCLTLATAFFSMSIYDRVIPNQAHVTLWTLAIGTSLAICLEFAIRWLKALLIDASGKKADLLINASLFREIQRIRLEHRPTSIGSFTSSMRDFESIREFFSSATLVAVTDLPFSLVFLFVIYLVGGPIVLVPLAAVPIMIAISWLTQPLLGKALRANMAESSQRQAVLVETLMNFETIKSMRAESFLQTRYENANAFAAQSFNRVKEISSFVTGLSGSFQQLVNVAMIVWGVYLIETNTLTQGGLIAASMLSGRAVAPLAQIMGLATRYQQARLALETLKGLAKRPKEKTPVETLIAPEKCFGALEASEVGFGHPTPEKIATIKGVSFKIQPGERVGVLGRIGSGKSTLLRLLAGLYTPMQGSVLVDGLNLTHLDLAVMRKHVSFLGQEAQLFHGTVRENLVLSDSYITDDQITAVLRELGMLGIIESHPKGLNMILTEGGAGLSGGQKQLLAVARTMLRSPKIVLLDEPTSSMDQNTEALVIAALGRWLKGRTLVLVTHRPQLLGLVSRIMVMEGGKVMLDGARDDVISRLSQKP